MNNIDVLYEDNHLIILNKKPGDIVQGDKTGDTPLSEALKQYLKVKYNKPGEVYVGVAHRIDRPVSGIIIFAKTSKALARVNEIFREKKITKTYWALVQGVPKEAKGKLIHFMKKNEKQNKSYASEKETPGSLKAELDYTLLKKTDNYSLLEINLYTGRHHQIRCQLSAIGCPIKGDVKYGARRGNQDGSIHLHSRKAEFIHPVKQEKITVIAPVPQDNLWQAVEQK